MMNEEEEISLNTPTDAGNNECDKEENNSLPVTEPVCELADVPSMAVTKTECERQHPPVHLDNIARLYEKYTIQTTELERLALGKHKFRVESQNEEYRQQLLSRIEETQELRSEIQQLKEAHSAEKQSLERKNLENEYQLKALRDRFTASDAHHKKTLAELTAKYTAQIEQLRTTSTVAECERTTAVVKYAQREAELLNAKETAHKCTEQMKQITIERDALQAALRGIKNQKQQAKQTIEQKADELSDLHREIESLKNQLKEGEIKVKVANDRAAAADNQFKLGKKELDILHKRLKETQEELSTTKADTRHMLDQLQVDDRAKQAEHNTQIQEHSDQQEIYKNVLSELTELKKTHRQTLSEATLTKTELGTTQRELQELWAAFEMKKTNNEQMQTELERIRPLADLVNSSQSEAAECRRQLEEAVRDRAQAEKESVECRQEAERMLTLTHSLTAVNSALTAEVDMLKQKLDSSVVQLESLRTQVNELTHKLQLEEQSHSALRACSSAELESLHATVKKGIATEQQLQQQLNDERNQIKVLNKKHTAGVKELRNELNAMKRRLSAYESHLVGDSTGTGTDCQSKTPNQQHSDRTPSSKCQSLPGTSLHTSTSQSDSASVQGRDNHNHNPHSNLSVSRTSSVVSIDHSQTQTQSRAQSVHRASDCESELSGSLPLTVHTGTQQTHKPAMSMVSSSNGTSESAPQTQAMIEKICKLQRQMARRSEKIEFLDEHVRQLVDELTKKNKVLQSYMLREETGVLCPESVDMNKAELSRHGSTTMGALFFGHKSEQRISAEMGMQINARLQAVLEDTLYKNIMLKENLETMGKEIARLGVNHSNNNGDLS